MSDDAVQDVITSLRAHKHDLQIRLKRVENALAALGDLNGERQRAYGPRTNPTGEEAQRRRDALNTYLDGGVEVGEEFSTRDFLTAMDEPLRLRSSFLGLLRKAREDGRIERVKGGRGRGRDPIWRKL